MRSLLKRQSSKEALLLITIFIVSFGLRLITVLTLPPQFDILTADSSEYDNLAVNMITGKGYVDPNTGLPTSWHTPLYPIFLSGIYSVFGHSYLAVRIIQAVISALLCIFAFLIGQIVFDRNTGILSAIITAFYQPYIFYVFFGGPAFILSENLFTFLLAFLVFYLIRNLFRDFNFKNNFISGLLFGLLILTRAGIVLFPIFLFFLIIYKLDFPFSVALKRFSLLITGVVLIVLPWTARNCLVQKSFVPFSTESGYVLFSGNNRLANGAGVINLDTLLTQEERIKLNTMSEVQRDKAYTKYAKNYLLKNYKHIPKLVLKKFLVLWDIYAADYDLSGNRTRRFNIWYSIIISFALFGIYKGIRSGPDINYWLFILLFLYTSFVSLIGAGCQRFRYPVELYLIIFAAYGITEIYNKCKNRLIAHSIIVLVIGLNLIFYIYSDSILRLARETLQNAGM